MAWWGKVAGGTFGFMLGGPLGAILGATLGHQFDKGMKKLQTAPPNLGDQERVQTAFFTATFSVMGYISKVDGQVAKSEIRLAEHVMEQMRLSLEQRRVAIELFNTGKQDGFPLQEAIDQFRRECFHRTTLMQMFLEIQIQAALADGRLHASEQRVLRDVAARLGFDPAHLDDILRFVRGASDTGAAGGARDPGSRLKQAYELLGVDSGAGDAEVKKAYRRLMSQHHPDKLVSKGLPEEMMDLATEKTKKLSAAYELIKDSRQ